MRSEARPNVLVVLVDALRRDHLGTYGYPLPTSPSIDAFASESFRFTRAYSHSTWTKPSIATLFTSLYPEQHGLGRVGFQDEGGFQTDVLPKRLVTLAERLSKTDYATAAFSTNVHISRKAGFAQGFDHFFWKRLVDAFDLNELLQEWITARDETVPFFAYLHYMDAHWPYDRKLESESGRFGSTVTTPPAPEHWSQVPEWAAEHLTDENLAAIVATYDQEIAFVDRAFGELLDWLGQRGLMEETIIFFVADHGEGFNEHGELQHGFAPYEEVTAIPFMVRLPALYRVEPREVPDLVGLVDLMPTVLELVDVEAPRKAQGRSAAPLLFGEPMRERPIFVEGAGFRGMRGGSHSVFMGTQGESLCYDLAADPGESAPMRENQPEPCARLLASLEGLVSQFQLLADSDSSNATVTMDEEEIEALRALGYLD
jgi:arylsulfatase A-like enzyme